MNHEQAETQVLQAIPVLAKDQSIEECIAQLQASGLSEVRATKLCVMIPEAFGLALAWRLWHVPGLQGFTRGLLLLCAWQFLTGLTNVVLDWPLLAAVGHTGGAAALVIVFTGALAGTRSAASAPSASLHLSRSAR